MSKHGNQTLVFIHGVGGAPPRSKWLTPLSDEMARLGYSRPEQSGIKIITVDYRELLLSPDGAQMPAKTWRKPRNAADHYSAYQAGRAETSRLVHRLRQMPPKSGLGGVPERNAETLARWVEVVLRDLRMEARPYRTDDRVRASVLASVLADLSGHSRLVLVAHSLGSVVAADLIKRLPRGVVVDQLVTMGSPLPLHRFWPFIDLVGDAFPFDRLRGWVNVFDSLDPVGAGRGIGCRHPEATDVDIHFGRLSHLVGPRNHASEYYLSLPVVGALVGQALFGDPVTDRDHKASPARKLGTAWDLYLLSAAYALQVSATCESRKHDWRLRFDATRRASVLKLLADADANLHQLPEEVQAVPTEADFLDHAAELVRRNWSDEDLLPLALGMLMASPVRPYEIGIDPAHSLEALTSLFDRVRREDSNLSDPNFTKAVDKALKDAKKAMGSSTTRWAVLVLIGAGILAATGVGVVAAAPTGLAGAALMTSTLAAFGPGGMVGGMVTIAAASSAGSALIGAGATKAGDHARASAAFAVSLANLPKEQLRTAVTGWIARLIAEKELSFTSTVSQTYALLTAALVEVVNEENTHAALDSKGAKEWGQRREILERGLEWIDENFPSPAVSGVSRALGRSDGPLTIKASELRRLPAGLDRRLPALKPPSEDD